MYLPVSFFALQMTAEVLKLIINVWIQWVKATAVNQLFPWWIICVRIDYVLHLLYESIMVIALNLLEKYH